MPPRDLAGILSDVIDAARYIAGHRDRTTEAAFLADTDLQAIFERKFEILGEALGLLRKKHASVFSRIRHAKPAVDLRNVISHGYDSVDHALLWDIATRWLPEVLEDAELEFARLASGGGDSGPTAS